VKYRIVVTPAALRALEAIPDRRIREQIAKRIQDLTHNPEQQGKPLRGELAGRFRLRTGDYRLQFRVLAETVIVEKIGHRDRFYEE